MYSEDIREKCPQAWDQFLEFSGLRKAWHPFDNPKWFRQLYEFFDERLIAVEIGIDITLEAKYCYKIAYMEDGEWEILMNQNWSDLYYTRAEAEEVAFTKAFEILETFINKRLESV